MPLILRTVQLLMPVLVVFSLLPSSRSIRECLQDSTCSAPCLPKVSTNPPRLFAKVARRKLAGDEKKVWCFISRPGSFFLGLLLHRCSLADGPSLSSLPHPNIGHVAMTTLEAGVTTRHPWRVWVEWQRVAPGRNKVVRSRARAAQGPINPTGQGEEGRLQATIG